MTWSKLATRPRLGQSNSAMDVSMGNAASIPFAVRATGPGNGAFEPTPREACAGACRLRKKHIYPPPMPERRFTRERAATSE